MINTNLKTRLYRMVPKAQNIQNLVGDHRRERHGSVSMLSLCGVLLQVVPLPTEMVMKPDAGLHLNGVTTVSKIHVRSSALPRKTPQRFTITINLFIDPYQLNLFCFVFEGCVAQASIKLKESSDPLASVSQGAGTTTTQCTCLLDFTFYLTLEWSNISFSQVEAASHCLK